MLFEVSLQNYKGDVGVVYRSPSRESTKFENFLSKFHEHLSKIASANSYFTIFLGDFDARSLSWWKEGKATTEGTHLKALTFLHNFHQLTSEPKHLLPHSYSCIDLIFMDQPNLVVNCGIHYSLNFKCYHQITDCKLNLG